VIKQKAARTIKFLVIHKQSKKCEMIINKKIQLITLVAFLLIFSSMHYAQQLERPEVVVAYIYNFAKNIQWENEQEITEFQFRFIGEDQRIIRMLNKLANSETLRNKPIKVTFSESLTDLENIHLLFVGAARKDLLRSIFNTIEGKNILLVSDGYEDKRFIMINFIETPKPKLHFEINRANIINQNLKIMPDMVFLGGTEVDVAKLYKESQDAIRSREQKIKNLEQNLADLEQNLDDMNQQIEKSSVEIARQKRAIEDQNSEILRQRSQLTSEKKRRDELLGEIAGLENTLSSEAELLEARDRKLSEQLEEIESRNEILTKQQGKIDLQNNEIREQAMMLEERGATIAAQKKILYLLVTIIILVLFLITYIYLAYKDKKKRAAELAVAKKRAEEADQLKSIFIASISHELRTPLNSIIGLTGIILQGISGEITEVQMKELTMVKNSANHLLALINDVIDVSKIETGQVELAIGEFDLLELIQEVRDFFEVSVDEKGIKLSIELPERLIIKSDERRTKQVVMNLVSNAIKFTDKGKIAIKAAKKDERVEISVADAGIGIKKENMKMLFKQFSRIHVEGTTRAEGTGLGLYLSKKIAALLGGEISAESEFGKGSKFTFTLPSTFSK